MDTVLDGRDTLGIMPTGSGKSAVYQIAGLRLPGITVVVSPLIALQQDQVESIREQGIVKAAVLNSTLASTQREAVFQQVGKGEIWHQNSFLIQRRSASCKRRSLLSL